jgi:hypothetical protein
MSVRGQPRETNCPHSMQSMYTGESGYMCCTDCDDDREFTLQEANKITVPPEENKELKETCPHEPVERAEEWSVYQELAHVETSTRRARDMMRSMDTQIYKSKIEMKRQGDEITRKNANILEYGSHKKDCQWYDVVNSGRVLSHLEEQTCSCGWSIIKASLENKS